jgi:uncharacterized protein
MQCQEGCGACCIAPSISSYIPALGRGKLPDERCPHLTEDLRCELWEKPERPAVCSSLKACAEMCAHGREHALCYLQELERLTAPDPLD